MDVLIDISIVPCDAPLGTVLVVGGVPSLATKGRAAQSQDAKHLNDPHGAA
ncbi:hypothetical protein [Paracoccus contaminans]|uniref:hypothetical protein n=1 Tax=Paracoccus contaminans TaxID=1945662 RepID=UPI0012F52934|nr:hypothetical protein [Paracoccus contaminans]